MFLCSVDSPQWSSASFVVVGLLQVIVCTGLAYNSGFRSRKKRSKASDAYFAEKTNLFSAAHLADLFGADGKKFSAEEIKEGKREGEVRFTEELTEKMFRALDFDHDGMITQVFV